MCTAAALKSRAACAAQTQESIPPLSKTTARDVWPFIRVQIPFFNLQCRISLCTFVSFVVDALKSLNHKGREGTQRKPLALLNWQRSYALHRRVPDELMDLQSQASRDVVRQHPLREFPRIEQTVRGVACAT